MPKSVYVLEPQAIFIAELSRIVAAAGGRVARIAQSMDIAEIASLRVDYALLDLDYAAGGVLDGLTFFRGAAPKVKLIVLTEQRDFSRLARYRDAGATAILPKAMSGDELCCALRETFERGAHRVFYDGPMRETAQAVRAEYIFVDERA